MRIAAFADLHCDKNGQGAYAPFFARAAREADVLALCGDLTDYGLPEEAAILAREITTSIKLPVVAVLGNHDFESGRQDEVARTLRDAGVKVLDGDAWEHGDVGFAGVKGFCGGFDRASLQPWGEEPIKQFVREAVSEAVKLESALAKIRQPHRVVLMHYAPIRETVDGEPFEIYTFLGSSRLEDPLFRYPVDAVFHGHAHHGRPEGRTKMGTPVYNVAMPLLRRATPETPYRVYETTAMAGAPR